MLRRVPFSQLEPLDCATAAQPYQRGCVYKCKPGFTMNGGNGRLTCGADAKWTGQIPTCVGETARTNSRVVKCVMLGPEECVECHDVMILYNYVNKFQTFLYFDNGQQYYLT